MVVGKDSTFALHSVHESDIRSKDLTELINHMGDDGFHDYTATEALNNSAPPVRGSLYKPV